MQIKRQSVSGLALAVLLSTVGCQKSEMAPKDQKSLQTQLSGAKKNLAEEQLVDGLIAEVTEQVVEITGQLFDNDMHNSPEVLLRLIYKAYNVINNVEQGIISKKQQAELKKFSVRPSEKQKVELKKLREQLDLKLKMVITRLGVNINDKTQVMSFLIADAENWVNFLSKTTINKNGLNRIEEIKGQIATSEQEDQVQFLEQFYETFYTLHACFRYATEQNRVELCRLLKQMEENIKGQNFGNQSRFHSRIANESAYAIFNKFRVLGLK